MFITPSYLTLAMFVAANAANEELAQPEVITKTEIERIQITGDRMQKPGQIELSTKRLRQPLPAQDGADILRSITGFSSVRKGGASADPVFRGMSGSRLTVLTDGDMTLGGCPSRMDPPTAYITPQAFDYVNLIKGPQAVTHGPMTAAGTVRFERDKQLSQTIGTDGFFNMTRASFGRVDTNIDVTAANEIGYLRGAVNLARSDDYKDGLGTRVHSAYQRWNTSFSMARHFSDQHTLLLTLGLSDGEAAYADRGMDGSRFRREAARQRGFQASWRWWLLFLLSISVVGIVFLLGRRGSSQISNGRVFWGLLSLTAIWSLALAISGGAANAANAIQLILIAAAFMTLPATKAWLIFALIVMVQSTFLVSMLVAGEPHPHSHATPIGTSLVQDDLHYIGMSLTFLMAALLLSLTISYMQRSLQAQQREAQTMREAQLRQKQIIAMATASAQITHELATPLATIGMPYDELNEAKVRHPALTELEQPIAQVKSLLQYLRSVAVDIQSQQPQILTLSRLESQLQQQASLNFSTADIRWHLRSTDTDAST